MAFQSNIYTIGTSRTYLATKPIKGKDHMAVWVKPFLTEDYTQLQVAEYDLINNSAVVKESVILTQYEKIEVRVGDTPDDLTQSQSDIAIVAGIADDITDVAFIAPQVVIVATEPLTTAIIDVGTEPLKTAILNAGDNATASQLSAWDAEAENLTTNSYAVEAEDVFVKVYTSNDNGTFTATPTTEYSSLHWATKSAISETNAAISETNAANSAASINPTNIIHTTGSGEDNELGDLAIGLSRDQSVAINIATDADYTLTADENTHGRIEITDTGVILTTARNIIVDNVEHNEFIFANSTAQNLTVKTVAGTGILVPAGESSNLRNDTVNILDGDIQAEGGGKVLQTVTAEYNLSFSTSSTTLQDTGLTATITPTSTSSAILVLININHFASNGGGIDARNKLGIKRDSTNIYTINNVGIQIGAGNPDGIFMQDSLIRHDTPSKDTPTTYTFQFAKTAGISNVCFYSNTIGTITLIEIGI